jgi:hypothetical protein
MLDSLIDYVANEHRLPLKIKEARDNANYVGAAQELRDVLFTGKGDGANEANLALAALQEIVEQSATRPVIVARVFSEIQQGQGQNGSAFVPLGVLAAKGDGAVLKKPITVMQPLPRERYKNEICIDDWTFGFPDKLEKVNEDLSLLLPKNPIGTWYHDIPTLKDTYFSDATPAGNRPPQGFLLLAHHGHGNLWFDDERKRIIQQNIKREYPPGSVVVFAACSVATPNYDSKFVQRFNERGVDALIASPFPVPATYGTRLAVEFSQAIEEKKAGTTISDLFAAAIDGTARRLEKESQRHFEEMGLEYVLLGNPKLVLCDKPVTGK